MVFESQTFSYSRSSKEYDTNERLSLDVAEIKTRLVNEEKYRQLNMRLAGNYSNYNFNIIYRASSCASDSNFWIWIIGFLVELGEISLNAVI